MLDDCRGPKFEEVLAVFSTAVLRKVISENNPEAGIRLSLARNISESEVEGKLVPLIIAHHAALSSARRENVRIRESHEQFVALLDEKAKELSARSNSRLKVTEEFQSESLAHDVKANWLGSQHLLDALFNGGAAVEKDAFLELPFEKAWYHARKGNMDHLRRPSHVDLLQDMETLSSKQRARLQRLRGMKKMSQVEHANKAKAMPDSHKDRGLTFRDHQTLTVAGTSKSLRETVERRDLFAEHEAIIVSLRTSLSEVKGMQAQTGHSLHSPTLVEPANRPLNEALSPIPDIESVPPSPSPSPSVQVTDYEEYADSTSTALPPSFDISSSPDLPIKNPDAQSTEIIKQDLNPQPETRQFSHPSLLERTRQSMSLLPPLPTNGSRQSLASRRETRHSQYFPINQFQTPPKEAPETPSRSGASTPRDELFTEEAEYASIFKSRPRVAHSPLMSPAVHVGFDDEVEDGYVDSESVLELASAGSPLGRKRR
jgi:HAUS augmin-like complex subunit 6 N-terminus